MHQGQFFVLNFFVYSLVVVLCKNIIFRRSVLRFRKPPLMLEHHLLLQARTATWFFHTLKSRKK